MGGETNAKLATIFFFFSSLKNHRIPSDHSMTNGAFLSFFLVFFLNNVARDVSSAVIVKILVDS